MYLFTSVRFSITLFINLKTLRSRGEMDITRVFGTWIWGSSPYETAIVKDYYIFIKFEYSEITNSAI